MTLMELGALGDVFEQDMANLPFLQKGMKQSKKGAVSLGNYQEVRIRHLHQTLGEGDLIAIGTHGIIPYYTRLPTIDMWGLNDLHIAHKESPWSGLGDAGHEKGDGKYVSEKRPELIIFRAMMLSPVPFPIADLEYSDSLEIVVNRVEDSVIANPNAVSAPRGQLLGT